MERAGRPCQRRGTDVLVSAMPTTRLSALIPGTVEKKAKAELALHTGATPATHSWRPEIAAFRTLDMGVTFAVKTTDVGTHAAASAALLHGGGGGASRKKVIAMIPQIGPVYRRIIAGPGAQQGGKGRRAGDHHLGGA